MAVISNVLKIFLQGCFYFKKIGPQRRKKQAAIRSQNTHIEKPLLEEKRNTNQKLKKKIQNMEKRL